MGILNLAHGAFFMLGAYIGISLSQKGAYAWPAALAAGAAVALIGLVVERGLLRKVHNLFIDMALSTIGLSYVLANVCLLVWGPAAKMGTPPGWLQGSLPLGNGAMPYYRLALIAIGVITAGLMYWFQNRTRFGAIVRAGMDDKETTEDLGLNYGLVCSAVFALGLFIAGAAGSLAGPLVGAYVGQGNEMLNLAIVVVVVGGMGTVQGALGGALMVALVDNFGKVYFPSFAMFTIYAAMVIMLVIKPSGLLGRMAVQR
jgi:branched-chain amino acid transport system permease protein